VDDDPNRPFGGVEPGRHRPEEGRGEVPEPDSKDECPPLNGVRPDGATSAVIEGTAGSSTDRAGARPARNGRTGGVGSSSCSRPRSRPIGGVSGARVVCADEVSGCADVVVAGPSRESVPT
jgi:hypothetical protein